MGVTMRLFWITLLLSLVGLCASRYPPNSEFEDDMTDAMVPEGLSAMEPHQPEEDEEDEPGVFFSFGNSQDDANLRAEKEHQKLLRTKKRSHLKKKKGAHAHHQQKEGHKDNHFNSLTSDVEKQVEHKKEKETPPKQEPPTPKVTTTVTVPAPEPKPMVMDRDKRRNRIADHWYRSMDKIMADIRKAHAKKTSTPQSSDSKKKDLSQSLKAPQNTNAPQQVVANPEKPSPLPGSGMSWANSELSHYERQKLKSSLPASLMPIPMFPQRHNSPPFGLDSTRHAFPFFLRHKPMSPFGQLTPHHNNAEARPPTDPMSSLLDAMLGQESHAAKPVIKHQNSPFPFPSSFFNMPLNTQSSEPKPHHLTTMVLQPVHHRTLLGPFSTQQQQPHVPMPPKQVRTVTLEITGEENLFNQGEGANEVKNLVDQLLDNVFSQSPSSSSSQPKPNEFVSDFAQEGDGFHFQPKSNQALFFPLF